MSAQLYENLLKKFKKANVSRRLVIAGNAGYNTPEEYETYLKKQINGSFGEEEIATKTTTEKPTIHVVDILDCSGSMSGSKIKNAVDGINNGIDALKEEKEVNYLYGICTFSEPRLYTFNRPAPVNNQKHFNRPLPSELGGRTDLYGTIEKTLRDLFLSTPKDGKVLVNIYTDGEDNCFSTSTLQVARTIKEAEERGFTVTFVGINSDVESIIRTLRIDRSNTLSYDGTGEGLAKATIDTVTARTAYAKSVVKGEDVTLNFYSKIKIN